MNPLHYTGHRWAWNLRRGDIPLRGTYREPKTIMERFSIDITRVNVNNMPALNGKYISYVLARSCVSCYPACGMSYFNNNIF